MDILGLPLAGAFLRWRHARTAMQLVLLLVAAAVVLHGLLGPQLAPRNLATVLTSIHWRGLLIVAIAVVGNLFCTACPMVLARDVGRRFVHPAWRWPRRLRGKWLGLALLVLVLFSYELFDLWAMPRATAWLVIGYFGLAIVVDVLFSGASFCKHLCPIGQFNFTASVMSPTELRVVDRETCRSCRTSDCIKGRYGPAKAGPHVQPGGPHVLTQRGCELGLFLPMKVGNLDCTMCLDCVHACPHDNIALSLRTPGAELLERGRRSGIGRLGQRTDLAVLAVVFTFAALVSAFAMTSPAYAVEQLLATATGARSEWPILLFVFIVGLVIVPARAARRRGCRDARAPRSPRIAAHDHGSLCLCARSNRLRRLAGALRLPPAHWDSDCRARGAERGCRRVRPGAARRPGLGLGRTFSQVRCFRFSLDAWSWARWAQWLSCTRSRCVITPRDLPSHRYPGWRSSL